MCQEPGKIWFSVVPLSGSWRKDAQHYQESTYRISWLLSYPQMLKEKPLADFSAHIFALLLFKEFSPGCLPGSVYLI